MKQLLTIIIFSLFLFSCGKKSDCSSNNTGSVLIHNDGDFIPSGVADFYLGSTKIVSVAKGAEAIADNIPVGPFIVTVKIGADTIYIDQYLPDTVKQCQELHYSTGRFLPVSDKRLKKNIIPVNNVLANLGKLNIYSYEYHAPGGYSGFLPNGKHFGFMAQELKEVYPNFVQLNSNGYYSVNYQEMIPLLAKGMQEQQTQIEELKKEVAELKSLVKLQQSVAMK